MIGLISLLAALNLTNATASANSLAAAAASIVPGGIGGSLISELIIIVAILIVVFIIFKVGKVFFKLLFGIIANSILGLVVIFVANRWLYLAIPLTLPILLPTILFGLPGIGTIILMRLLGAPI
jgi:hypothetical protein